MKRTIGILLLFAGVLSTICSRELSVIVIDRDLDMPLEGVKIVETDSGVETFTDYNGKGVLTLDDDIVRAVITTELIGYEPRKQLVTDFSNTLTIGLLMEGILEGQELVVEAEAIGETDEAVGVSTVIEQETIKAAAKIGFIEDVMSAVKILPGVTYSGSFGSMISVRGGDPSGLTAVMDGFTTKYPYHWGGAFSIFNPNIVESIKFSPGIFSVKHGQATSALMEVNTVNPTEGFKFNTIFSTSTMEAFVQTPIVTNNEIGVLGGFRLTNYDLVLAMVNAIAKSADSKELLDTIEGIHRAPYIYDFYFKTFYTPSETFKWHLNAFWGNDGVGIKSTGDVDKTKEVQNEFYFDYSNSDFFVSTGLKMLPTDRLLLNLVLGYEIWMSDIDAKITEDGRRYYSDDFKAHYTNLQLLDPSLPALTGDYFDVFTESKFKQDLDKYGFQGRLDADWSLTESLLLQAGIGSNLEIRSSESSGIMWQVSNGELPTYSPVTINFGASKNSTLLNFAYANLNSDLIPEFISMELGCRLDHSYFMGEDDLNLNTYPEFAPRVNLTFTPEIDSTIFMDNSFSIGAGLFNKNPFGNGGIKKEFEIEDFEMKSEKTFMAVGGWETHLPRGYKFKIEGYYKYFYDRFYFNQVDDNAGMRNYRLHFDGYGHAFGGDFMLERKKSRYLDGLISYTFVNARYMDPESDGVENDSQNVRGEYYYPSYHRFNSLNFLLNIKPTYGFTVTTKLSFATGVPKGKDQSAVMFPGFIQDANGINQVAEMYTRNSIYSDTLRTNIALPLDIKLSWHNYKKRSKYQWEFYIAVEDVLSPLLKAIQPDESTQTDKWSGKEQDAPSSAFSFPTPSVGFSLSF